VRGPAAAVGRLGAVPVDNRSVEFRVWAPAARSVEVRIEGRAHPLAAEGEGFHAAVVPAVPGARYAFALDGRPWPDPCSRRQPDGTGGPSAVVEIPPATRGPRLRLEELVLYELHVGAFSEQRALGITAIELMPVGTFPGRRNWRYDGLYTSAPHKAYAGPAGLARLLEAHTPRGSVSSSTSSKTTSAPARRRSPPSGRTSPRATRASEAMGSTSARPAYASGHSRTRSSGWAPRASTVCGEEAEETGPFQTDHTDPAIAKATREESRREFSRFSAFSTGGVPDPQAEETFQRSKLAARRPEPFFAELLALHHELPRRLEVHAEGDRVSLRRGTTELIVDFAAKTVNLRR
jgi:hypothetical protein